MAIYTTINDPSAQFQVALWTGDGNSTKAITNDGNSNLQPDLVWLKNRSGAENHTLADSSRGVTYRISSNSNNAEDQNGVASVQTDGFTVSSSYNGNANGNDYVGWQWKVNGGSTSSNSNGTITSNVQINTTAGFSIVKYTGNGSSGSTVGHGFTSAPDLVIVKCTSTTGYWINSSMDYGTNSNTSGPKNMYWNTNDYAQSDGIVRSINATNFEISSSSAANSNSQFYVAYCWKTIPGYSMFGSYSGNGGTDGPFIFTGFKPAYVQVKSVGSTGGAQNWRIADHKRSTSGFNPVDKQLEANSNSGTDSGNEIDIVSNGFKIRTSAAQWNADGVQFAYIAFAEMPMVASNKVIALAR
tara:strand:+ start:1936 stop:3003 length:1068 start_codon:yes stop_codon:yes gene_type:complete